MTSHIYSSFHFGAIFMGLSLLLTPSLGFAQSLAEMNAVTEGMNTLNESSPATGSGLEVLRRARELEGGEQSEPEAKPAIRSVSRSAASTSFDAFGEDEDIPKITVITGTRIFDAVTGELIDDALLKELPETERDNYFDDGTNGDLLAQDEIFTLVDTRNDVIGQSNQRVKEQLVMALISADDLDPLMFYGFNLMSTERHETLPRKRAWKVIPDPDGVGSILAEMETDQPVLVPKYREWQAEKDKKVRNDWSYRFLQEYRLNKDSLTSEFYSLYIPIPPQVPTIAPPPFGMWEPFADPEALQRYHLAKLSEAKADFAETRRETSGGGGGGGGGSMAGAPGGM